MPRAAVANRSQKRLQKYSVPITVALAAKLKAAAKGRAGDALLLLRADGSSWGAVPGLVYRRAFLAIAARLGLDPEVTAYADRKSVV